MTFKLCNILLIIKLFSMNKFHLLVIWKLPWEEPLGKKINHMYKKIEILPSRWMEVSQQHGNQTYVRQRKTTGGGAYPNVRTPSTVQDKITKSPDTERNQQPLSDGYL